MTELPALRERFPGAESVWARFDGPAGTLVLDAVIDATATWQSGVNPSNTGGAFSMSEACTALIADARAAVGTLLGASAESIVWGPSATQLITNVSRAVADGLSPGDEIVCTELDHEANISPWRLVARERGLELRFARLDAQTGEMKLAAVEEAMSERTRWVAVSGASNVLGTIPDLRAIADLAHEAGARVLVDGVHLTPHCPVDVGALGCDVFVTSAYKWFGPHLSAMYADPALRDALEIHLLGDGPTEGPSSFELGTPPFEALAGVEAAATFLNDTGRARLAEHEATVFAPLLEGLQSMRHVTTYGLDTLEGRTPTVLFNVDGFEPSEVAAALARRSIALWSGHNYGLMAIEALDLNPASGGVRAGVSPYTSSEDVDRLLNAIDDLSTLEAV